MKKFLENLLSKKQSQLDELRSKIDNANSVDEVRSLSAQAESIKQEMADARTQISELEANEQRAAQFNPAEARTVATATKQTATENEPTEKRSSMEYRQAFMKFVQSGERSDVLEYEQRSDATGTSANLGVLIPQTIVQSIITDVEKVYGQLYSRVRKTNIPGGIKYPTGSFNATFNRVSETGKSDRQAVDGVTGYVEFSYKVGEIRLARTLLQTVLSVPVFEQKFSEVIVKAYVEAMDKEIMVGTDANNQCVGILTEAKKATGSRISADHIIEFTDADMADWASWQTKLFANIPLAMRGLNPEFVMTANTYEADIKTLKDDNNRPLFNETFNPVDGTEIARFKGKDVVFVEDDVLANFDDAHDGDYFGMYWVPEEAYAINSNMDFNVIDYFDQETNQYIKKALVINDGKILDPKYIYLLKKKVTG